MFSTERDFIIEKKSRSESSKDYVYRMLFKNIVFCRMLPGESISENTISEIFSVSRTPVRESVLKLAADELIYVYPQKGTYVSYINMDRIRESTFMRVLLETEALKLACRAFKGDEIFSLKSNLERQVFCYRNNNLTEVLELDNRFHGMIFEFNSLSRVWKALQGISAEQYRIRYLKLMDNWRWNETIEEHQMLIQDIQSGNGEKAALDIKSHINKIFDDANFLEQKHKTFFEHD